VFVLLLGVIKITRKFVHSFCNCYFAVVAVAVVVVMSNLVT